MGFCRQNAIRIVFLIGLFWKTGLFLSSPVEAFFTTSAVSRGGIVLATAEEWGEDETPPSSEVVSLPVYQNQKNFVINYSFSDEASGVESVEIFYRYNHEADWSSWKVKSGLDLTGSCVFDSPRGDGFYELMSQATDKVGNKEEKILADTSTTLDTQPPVTAFSFSQTPIVANDRVSNGSFEDGLAGWNNLGAVATTTDFYDGSVAVKLFQNKARISQILSLVGLNLANLSFWYRLQTSEEQSGGYLEVLVNDQKIWHEGWDDPEMTGLDIGWKNISQSLTGFLGQEIKLEFFLYQPQTDYQTWAYLDQVKVCAAPLQTSVDDPGEELVSNDGAGSNNSLIESDLNEGDGEQQILTYASVDEAGNQEATRTAVLALKEEIDYGIVLNEIAPNEGFVTLFNTSLDQIDTSGWKVINSIGQIWLIDNEAVKIEGLLFNNQKETVYLYDRANRLVDSYAYDLAEPLPAGKSFKRDPDGVGGWKDPVIEPVVQFYRQGEDRVGFLVQNLANYQKLVYEIRYQTKSQSEGITGVIEINQQKQIKREDFILGSCSAGGSCVYHQHVKDLQLRIKLEGFDEKEIIRQLD